MNPGDYDQRNMKNVVQSGVSNVADTVQRAVLSGDYSNLSRDVSKDLEELFGNIGRTVNFNNRGSNPTVQQGTMGYRNPVNESYWQGTQTSQKIRDINRQRQQQMYGNPAQPYPMNQPVQRPAAKPFSPFFREMSNDKIAYTIGMVLGYMTGGTLGLVFGGLALLGGWVSAIMLILLLLPISTIAVGAACHSQINLINRYQKYVKCLNGKTYIDIEKLSELSGRDEKALRKDLQKMIDKKWFPQGHFDEDGKTLIVSNETYQQYLETQQAAEEREKEREKEEGSYTESQREIFRMGEIYIEEIRKCNQDIPDPQITAKLDRMEHSVRVILDRAKEKPSLTGDLRRLMNYYLPTMVKLLQSYIDLDRQDKTSANIEKSKQEVVNTIDMMNDAFDQMFDELFDDTSLDIATDVEVMRTLLQQEGLTGHNFSSDFVMPEGSNNTKTDN